MTVPDLNSENSLTQQVMYSAAADQFSSRNLAGRHIAVNPTSPAPHEVASFSLPFPGKSKLGTASENVTASGMNITYYPGVCVCMRARACVCVCVLFLQLSTTSLPLLSLHSINPSKSRSFNLPSSNSLKNILTTHPHYMPCTS